MHDVFNIVVEGSKKVAPVVGLIAYVDVNPRHDLGFMDFAQVVAVKQGVNIHNFKTVRDAETWLVAELWKAWKPSREAPEASS